MSVAGCWDSSCCRLVQSPTVPIDRLGVPRRPFLAPMAQSTWFPTLEVASRIGVGSGATSFPSAPSGQPTGHTHLTVSPSARSTTHPPPGGREEAHASTRSH